MFEIYINGITFVFRPANDGGFVVVGFVPKNTNVASFSLGEGREDELGIAMLQQRMLAFRSSQ